MQLSLTQKMVMVVIAFCAIAAHGTWFLLFPSPPGWCDPNIVGDDELLPASLRLGQSITGWHIEDRPGIVVAYTLDTHPDTFTWHTDEPNQLNFNYVPIEIGVEYVRVLVSIEGDIPGGQQYHTLAFRTLEAVMPSDNWFWELVR